jgi:tRNA-2-methylthio-N6-dimethylallyladenosine synthase
MNKLDSELLTGELLRRGFEPVSDPNIAEIVIYNTCSVRQHAEDRVLSHLGSWRRRAEKDSQFVLGVMGCVAQRLGPKIQERYPFVQLVCGTGTFAKVPDYLERIVSGEKVLALHDETFTFHRDSRARRAGHHAYVSIMRGCNNFCAYCIVPYVRGREVSRPPGEILDELRQLCGDGAVEVTLLGQNVNSYGKDLGDVTLASLLEKVNSFSGLKRIRFVTSHPKDMTEDIFRAIAQLEKVCEHIHMPAQSGSDVVLERMNRRCTRAHYLELIEAGRRLIPEVEFSSDFLVGFPGETDRDFELTLSLLKNVRFQQSFIFKYSPRPGTLAATWPDDVSEEVKRERNQIMLKAQEEVDTARRASLVGSAVEVLVERPNPAGRSDGELAGRTPQNDIVVFSGCDARPGSLCRVRIESATHLTLHGRCIT